MNQSENCTVPCACRVHTGLGPGKLIAAVVAAAMLCPHRAAAWCSSSMAISLLLLVQLVAADVKQLSAAVLGDVPVWVQNRSADIVLDFRKADPHYKHPSFGMVQVRGKGMRVNFHIGYYHGNVAIVRYGTSFLMAVRKMHFYKTLRTAIENYPLSTKKGEQR